MALRRRGAAVVFACVLVGLVVSIQIGRGAAALAPGELIAQPALGAPAETFLGASPGESAGEVWATASAGQRIARFTEAAGWEVLPPVESEGQPVAELTFFKGAAVGRTTADGGVVAAAKVGEGQRLVVHDPGGSFRLASEPGEALLGSGEKLFGSQPLLAATEEPGGTIGAYVVPVTEPASATKSILAYDGHGWSKEAICIKPPALPGEECEQAPGKNFRVLAIEGGPGSEAWMLGRSGNGVIGQPIELFAREPNGEWLERELGSTAPGSVLAKPPGGLTIAARSGQPLTVTSEGVWVDATLKTGAQPAVDGTFFYSIPAGRMTGSWCDLNSPAGLCAHPLDAEFPAGEYRSFAWPSGGPFGQRAVTGVGEGALLELEGESFLRLPLSGGSSGAEFGAALSSPEAGWLGTGNGRAPLQLGRVGSTVQASQLQSWPVPFRRPLLAIAPQPGAPVGGLGSKALAVGVEGEVARFEPGIGWQPEALLNAGGQRARPTLRGVAWPEPGFAYAVGDQGEMWLWRAGTGLWEPDPGKPPNLGSDNFTGIAFDPGRPERGYAIGKQGVLLGYGREWVQETLPPEMNAEANLTSIAFAGEEALVAYKFPKENEGGYVGGLLVNSGSGWSIEPEAAAALGEFGAPQAVAGLPDGGAVMAASNHTGEVEILERNGPGAPWISAPKGLSEFPTALAAVREGGQVRAVVSVGQAGFNNVSPLDAAWRTDEAQVRHQPALGEPPLLTEPYPLPMNGFLVRQTNTGWRDEQHEAIPAPSHNPSQLQYDLPVRPDPVLALLLAPDGSGGWAVGGVTGEESARGKEPQIQTAGVQRYGPGAAPPSNFTPAPIQVASGTATFAIGGNSRCAGPCADLMQTGIGPQRWLGSAVGDVAALGTGKVRAFLYTGPGVAESGEVGSEQSYGSLLSPLAFAREEAAYAQRLGSSAGAMPVYAAPTSTDLDAQGSLGAFTAAFGGFDAPLGGAIPSGGVAPIEAATAGHGYYSFESSGEAGVNVRVIVLDYAARTLEASSPGQQCWLAQELSAARSAHTPAIVLGARDLAGLASNAAEDSTETRNTLVGGAPPAGCVLPGPAGPASAYFFDYPEENRQYRLTSGSASVPAFGTGTLGYIGVPGARNRQFLGASGYLLASVGAPEPTTNIAPVSAELIPDVGSLALDAADGTLLRRSQTALFEGLARRPLAGDRCGGTIECTLSPDPYIPIPSECTGPNCSTGLLPEYRFSSSRPDIADFVQVNPAANNPRSVLLVNGKAVSDPRSGLLCAFNAGTTTVTIAAGGLSYSEPVTVQPGSVERPCGTVPLLESTGGSVEPLETEPPFEGEKPPFEKTPPLELPNAPHGSGQQSLPHSIPQHQSIPQVRAPAPHHPPQPVPHSLPNFFQQTPGIFPIVPIIPVPGPPAVEPTPPSGTSPVTQPATSPEPEEEQEAAIEQAHHMSAVSHPRRRSAATAMGVEASDHGFDPLRLLPVIVLIAALAGAAGRTRRRPDVAPVISTRRRNRP
jgi:hypothetical protein